MRPAAASAGRAALQRAHRKRVPQIVQARTVSRPRSNASLVDQPVEGLLDGNVAQRPTALVDEHRIIVRAGPATCQVSLQAGGCRVVQRHQSRLAELGLADQQTVAGHVSDRQLQGFGDPEPGG